MRHHLFSELAQRLHDQFVRNSRHLHDEDQLVNAGCPKSADGVNRCLRVADNRIEWSAGTISSGHCPAQICGRQRVARDLERPGNSFAREKIGGERLLKEPSPAKTYFARCPVTGQYKCRWRAAESIIDTGGGKLRRGDRGPVRIDFALKYESSPDVKFSEPNPNWPAASTVSGREQATNTGGCGCCTGLGMIAVGGM